MREIKLYPLLRLFAPKYTRADIEASRKINWAALQAPTHTEEDAFRFMAWMRRAKKAAPTIVDFVERVLSKAQAGKLSGKLVFIGRNGSVFLDAAKILSKKYGVKPSSFGYVDLPVDLLLHNPPERVREYLREQNVPSDNVSFVDDGTTGKSAALLKRVLSYGASEHKASFYYMAALDPRLNSWLRERPWRFVSIMRSLNFLGNQPHASTRPVLSVADGKVNFFQEPTPPFERFGVAKVREIIEAEARKRLPGA